MQTDYLRDLRYKLQKRVRRLNASTPPYFIDDLKRFWRFFDSIPTLRGIADELEGRYPNVHGDVNVIFGPSGSHCSGETDEENAAIGHGVLRRLQYKTDSSYLSVGPVQAGKHTDMLDEIRTLYLVPFYDYVDEHLDDWSFVVATLIRYKHSGEWFRRDNLHQLWTSDSRKGEELLVYDLYEYLYDKGIEFHIEPSSASGEPDAVSAQSRPESFIIEAKVFDPQRNHGSVNIKNGFRQAYRYICDHNEAAGYLVIFNTSPTPPPIFLLSHS